MHIIKVLGLCCLTATQVSAQVNVPQACRDLAHRAGYSSNLSEAQAHQAYQDLESKNQNDPSVKRCRRAVNLIIQKAMEEANKSTWIVQ